MRNVRSFGHTSCVMSERVMEATFPVTIEVLGEPQPAGSKRSWVPLKDGKPIPRKNGKGFVTNTVDDNRKKVEPWKRGVEMEARNVFFGALLDGPLVVEMIFYRQRPKGHYGTGRNAGIVKDSAPAYPQTKPDVLKLARAAEDALTNIVWRDDALIVDERISKRYGPKPGVTIRIWLAEARSVRDLVAAGQPEPTHPDVLFEQLSLVPAAA